MRRFALVLQVLSIAAAPTVAAQPRTPTPAAAVQAPRGVAAASGHVKRLVEAGVLREVTGRKRDQIFVAPGILAFMHDRPETPR